MVPGAFPMLGVRLVGRQLLSDAGEMPGLVGECLCLFARVLRANVLKCERRHPDNIFGSWRLEPTGLTPTCFNQGCCWALLGRTLHD